MRSNLLRPTLVGVLFAVSTASAFAGPPVEALDGLEALQAAVETVLEAPAELKKRRFVLDYRGPLDRGEKLVLRLEPKTAFAVKRLDRRRFEVRVVAPRALLQEDFLREITVYASRTSARSLVGRGKGRCGLAVRFASDVGQSVNLTRYRQVDVEWWPREAANLVGKGGGHVLFRRTPGHAHTPVEVRAVLQLGDGSTRATAPASLGYCEPPEGPRLGVVVGGGSAWLDGPQGAGEVAVPLELRFGRAHARLAPALLWQAGRFGAVGQGAVGHRFGSGLGLRIGGEAGWIDGLRAAGFLEGTWALDARAAWEMSVRVRAGTQEQTPFGEALLTLGVLPLAL